MHTSNYLYHHGEQELHGFLAYDDRHDKPRPAVLVAHDWSGRNEFACEKAIMLAEMGYVGFALDMYGQARIGETQDEKMALMQPLAADRRLLRDRIQAAFDSIVGMPEVDSTKIGAIGFCFGGLCVLDLARSGADLQAVVSFHGLLKKAPELPNETILAKILVLHGYDDPMVTPQDVKEFCQEMTTAQVDWQVYMYSQTAHAFTNPAANDPRLGTIYNEVTASRAFEAMTNFFNRCF